jgi:hypothetical protein
MTNATKPHSVASASAGPGSPPNWREFARALRREASKGQGAMRRRSRSHGHEARRAPDGPRPRAPPRPQARYRPEDVEPTKQASHDPSAGPLTTRVLAVSSAKGSGAESQELTDRRWISGSSCWALLHWPPA